MNDKLRECPFCGDKDVSIEKYIDSHFYVQCDSCYSRGGMAGTKEDAIREWNIRCSINTPKHETVEQWEERKLPDRSRKCIVWRYGEDPREMLFNHHGSWQVVGDYETFHCSHFTHWIYMPLTPNHHGKPDNS